MPCPSLRARLWVGLALGAASVAALAAGTPPFTDITHPPPDTLLSEGDHVRIEAGAWDTDGAVLKVEFYLDDALLGEVAPGPFRLLWTNATLGSHTLTAVAMDDSLLRSTSRVVTVTVEPPAARTLTWQPPNTSGGGEWNSVTANWRFNGRPTLFHAGDAVVFGPGGGPGTNFIGLDGAAVPVAPASLLLLGQGTFSGGDILTGSLEVSSSSSFVFSNYPGSLSFPGGTILRPSTSFGLTFDASAVPNGASVRFGAGPIVNMGTFSFQPASNRVATLENDFVVTNLSPCVLSAGWRPGAAARFSGRLTLGGQLNIQLQNASYSAPAGDAIEWAGPIVLDQSRALGGFPGTKINVQGNYSPRSLLLSGNITDGPGNASNRLRLQAYAVPAIRLTGANTYTRGTTIENSPSAPQVVVEVAPESSLGAGDLEVQGGGRLRLMGSRNLRPGAHATIHGRVTLEPGVKIRLRSLTLGPSNFTTGLFSGTNPPGSFQSQYLSSNGTLRLPATNIPPVVALELPLDGTNHMPGANLVLRAAVADPDSYIARVEFRMNGALLGVRTNAPYQLTLREMPAGTSTFQAVATDDDGGVGVSGVAAITVLPRITRIENAPGGALIHFDTLVNHALTLQATESWMPDDWTNLHSVPPAAVPGPASHFDPYPSNRNARYYRLRIP